MPFTLSRSAVNCQESDVSMELGFLVCRSTNIRFLNVNGYDDLIYRRMRERMVGLCPQYWEDPSLYKIENEELLRTRYEHLGLRDTSFLRLDSLCLAEARQDDGTMFAEHDNPASTKRASP